MERMIEDVDLRTKIVFDSTLYKNKHGRFGNAVTIKSSTFINPGKNSEILMNFRV